MATTCDAIEQAVKGVVLYPYQGGKGEEEYPIADFYKPLEYGWSEAQYQADQAIKEYIEGSHGDR